MFGIDVGAQGVLLRMLGRKVYSVYGPSIDSGCLPENGAVTIYPYPDAPRWFESLYNTLAV